MPPGRSRFVCALILAAVCLAPSSASAAVLYDQTSGAAGGSITSTDFTAPNDGLDAQGADDFSVPSGFPWNLTSVDVPGGVLEGDTIGVFLYADAGTVPGPEIFRQLGIPVTSAIEFAIPITGAPGLGPGDYWISVQAFGPDQWSWAERSPVVHDPAVWRNPPGGYGHGCTSYAPLASCSLGATLDFRFRLNGNVASNLFTLGKLKRKRNGSATIPATFQAPGEVVVAQGGTNKTNGTIKTIASAVGGPGETQLTIKPSKKGKRVLARTGTLSSGVSITFTPTGGTANAAVIRAKLKLKRR
jgi:hypothetical protein